MNTFEEGVVINGIKWATRNVNAPGTFVEKVEDYGMYYQKNIKVGWCSNGVSTKENSAWLSSNREHQWTKENDPSPNGWRLPKECEI